MNDYIIDIDTGIYRITPDGKIFSQPKRKIPLVSKGMKFTGKFKYILGDEKEMSTNINNRGYRAVSFNHTTQMIHKLVAKGFVKNPENKKFVNHLDGNKLNNHYSNLEWCTIAENNEHARKTGLHPVRSGYKIRYKSSKTRSKALANLKDKSKLSDDEVRYCRANHIPRDKAFSATALSLKFGTSVAAMCQILNYKTYINIK